MSPWHTTLDHQLEELTLIRCSLLPGERFTFILPPSDFDIWVSLLEHDGDDGDGMSRSGSLTTPPCPARFEIRIEGVNIWFEVELPSCAAGKVPAPEPNASPTLSNTSISVKGENISRDDQEHWNAIIRERSTEIASDAACEFPIYELLTLLLPSLHQLPSPASASPSTPAPPPSPPPTPSYYHALLTSHHLISPTKRRLIHQWSHTLPITGFSKIGYPGVIYVEGPRAAVEEFVRNVKGMQWLALRVRFQEPVPGAGSVGGSEVPRGERWVEVSKIGEVLEQMRKRGREALVTDLGIGAPLYTTHIDPHPGHNEQKKSEAKSIQLKTQLIEYTTD